MMIRLLRMARWVRHPPSKERVRLVFWVFAVCLALAATERLVGWPEALTPSKPWGLRN